MMLDGANPRRRPAGARAAEADATRRDIIAVATAEFAEKGLTGASVNDIAARTRTSKPMIYYHFTSKEGLYAAVMAAAYGGIRELEQGLALDGLAATEAMRQLVEATFDYHADHPEFVRLISVENIHGARHIAGADGLRPQNATAIDVMRALLARGVAEGVFKDGLDPVDVHLLVSACSFYRVSNRHTWMVLFGVDLAAPGQRARQREAVVRAVLGYLKPGPDTAREGS